MAGLGDVSVESAGYWSRNVAYHGWVLKQAAAHAGDVLEVGCGDGLLTQRLAAVSNSVLAIDTDAAHVALARRRLRRTPGAAVELAEFDDWGLEPASFDVVSMVGVLHRFDAPRALARARELLRPGGSLLVVDRAVEEDRPGRLLRAVLRPLDRAGEQWHRLIRNIEVETEEPAPTRSELLRLIDPVDGVVPSARVRRGVYGRFLLHWAKPVPVLPGPHAPSDEDAAQPLTWRA